MKLNFKKQIPKIVLAESLACTAILAHGLLSKNVALAEETNKILNVYNDSKGEQSEGEKKVDEYLKAAQTLYGPSAVGQIGPAEKESLKKIYEEIAKEEAERTDLVEKVISYVQDIKALGLKSDQLKKTEKELEAMDLNLSWEYIFENEKEPKNLKEYMPELMSGLNEDKLNKLISKLEDELYILEGNVEEKRVREGEESLTSKDRIIQGLDVEELSEDKNRTKEIHLTNPTGTATYIPTLCRGDWKSM